MGGSKCGDERGCEGMSYHVKECPKCSSRMILGATHSTSRSGAQWECHRCGYIEQKNPRHLGRIQEDYEQAIEDAAEELVGRFHTLGGEISNAFDLDYEMVRSEILTIFMRMK